MIMMFLVRLSNFSFSCKAWNLLEKGGKRDFTWTLLSIELRACVDLYFTIEGSSTSMRRFIETLVKWWEASRWTLKHFPFPLLYVKFWSLLWIKKYIHRNKDHFAPLSLCCIHITIHHFVLVVILLLILITFKKLLSYICTVL